MSEEQNQEATPVEAPSNSGEVEQLKKSIEGLEKKNYELIGKMQKKELMEVPDDYEKLKEFKRNAEQSQLEQQGKYGEAKQALEQQYRENQQPTKKELKNLKQKQENWNLFLPPYKPWRK